MRAISHVFCDESGNTGQNLADLSQPVFTLASTTIGQTEATRLLQPFAVLNQSEVKYSKVRKTSKGQRLILDFLNDPAVIGQVAKIYVVHKPFMIVSKIVDIHSHCRPPCGYRIGRIVTDGQQRGPKPLPEGCRRTIRVTR
jgi:hypothetical protein